MCGRFSLTATPEDLQTLFGDLEFGPLVARYNIAPTQPILAVSIGPGGGRQAILVRWGLIPPWVKDPDDFTLLINARSETAAQKPSFRSAMRHKRILVPASGFYEWHRPADKKLPKQPYWVRPADGQTIAFGGLAESWMGKDGTEIDSGCILTTESNAQIGNIHHRMPVVIRPEDFDRWLDCKTNGPKEVEDLLTAVEDGFFEAIPVSDKVNKVANSGPEVQMRVSTPSGKSEPDEPPEAGGKDQMDLF